MVMKRVPGEVNTDQWKKETQVCLMFCYDCSFFIIPVIGVGSGNQHPIQQQQQHLQYTLQTKRIVHYTQWELTIELTIYF